MQLILKSKALLGCFLTCSVLLMSTTLTQAQKKELYIDSLQNIDSTVKTVNISLKARNLKNIGGLQGSINWDTAYLSYSNVTMGTSAIEIAKSDLGLSGVTKGNITFLWVDANLAAQTVDDGSTLFTVTFNVKKFIAGGKTNILLSNSPTPLILTVLNANGEPITATDTTYTNGLITFLPAVLPYQLAQFKSKMISDDCELSWATASEAELASVEVQKSKKQANAFATIATIRATGSTSTGKTYTYTDAKLNKGEATYYRLKFVTTNGRVSYSNVILASNGSMPRILVTPNPVRNLVRVQGNNLSLIKIVDMTGKIQVSRKVQSLENQVTINTTNFKAGSYLVQAITNDGSVQVQQLIVE